MNQKIILIVDLVFIFSFKIFYGQSLLNLHLNLNSNPNHPNLHLNPNLHLSELTFITLIKENHH